MGSTRVALISDLHANEVALEAVLADATRLGVDRIVCLGDVATLGPRPTAVLARLRELGCACILGNHDEFLLDPELIHKYTEAPVIVDSVDWCRARVSADELAFIRGFVRTLELPLAGGATLLLFHGSPRSHMEDIIAQTPADKLEEMLGGRRATVMAGGHTHVQMLRQHRGILLVNPGSVGMPFKEYVGGRVPAVMPHAEYAVVEASAAGVGVTLRRIELDRAALRASLQGSDLPLARSLLPHYA
jgi:predicted phosphodiesterase